MKDRPGHRKLDDILDAAAPREVIGALKHAHGHRPLAAKMQGVTRSMFYRKMDALAMDPWRPTDR